jgi:hypothetical protein
MRAITYPGRCKEEDVDASEQDEYDLRGARSGIGGTGDADDPFTNTHSDSTVDEKRTATKALDGPERDGSGADIDDGGDHGDEESVFDSWKKGHGQYTCRLATMS